MGRAFAAADTARRLARPVGHAGDREGVVSGQGAAGRRGSGDLSADDDAARRARRENRARVLVVRRRVRLRAVRRPHRSVLGALARARIPQPGAESPAGGRDRVAWARCDRRRLGIRVRARRSPRPSRSRPVARAQRLVPEVRTEGRAGRLRSREHRRHGAPVPGRAGPGQAARIRHHAGGGRGGARQGQPGLRRLGRRAGRVGVHGAVVRLPAHARRFPSRRAAHRRHRHAGPARRRRTHPGRPGDAARYRGTERAGRSDGRCRRDALGQERADDDRRGEGEARRPQAFAACRRRDRHDLRPIATDRARGRQPDGQADRGIRHRRCRLRGVPVPSAQRAGRDPVAAARRIGRVHRDALPGRECQPDVARGGSRSRSAR